MTDREREAHCRLAQLRGGIEILALHVSKDPTIQDDLKQEMAARLLTLPSGQTRAWYLSRLGDHARKYLGRCIIDAPLDRSGRAILDRQTVTVGGLAELDRLWRRAA